MIAPGTAARAPFSWNSAPNAGFTTGKPWMDPCANAGEINAAAEEDDPDSVLNFYRKLIRVRKGRPAVLFGKTEFLLPEDPDLMVYTRTDEAEALLSVNNFSSLSRTFALPDAFLGAELLLSNCGDLKIRDGVVTLRPWEGFTLLTH